MIQKFKITWIQKLTNDVYEITFKCEKKIKMIPGQFVTFLLDKIWGRAYSILEIKWDCIVLIIKKWEIENWWRWGSKFICELKVWDELKWVWPAGHFLLKDTNKNKLFIWTWTWFVPLYNQILWVIENNMKANMKLIFGVKTKDDLFYTKKLEEIKSRNKNFDFEIYLSREKNTSYKSWYVTDFITKQNIDNFEEFYICGTPNMIDWAKESLENLWKKEIYFEKY